MRQEYSAGGRPAFIEATPDGSHALGRHWPLIAGRVAGFARRVANCQADIAMIGREALSQQRRVSCVMARFGGAYAGAMTDRTTVSLQDV